jgi:hypothetical protein
MCLLRGTSAERSAGILVRRSCGDVGSIEVKAKRDGKAVLQACANWCSRRNKGQRQNLFQVLQSEKMQLRAGGGG